MTVGRRSRTVQRVLYPADDQAPVALYLGAVSDGVQYERSTLHLPARSRASLNAYFAAFPAALWMRVAAVGSVTFSGEARGTVVVRVSVRNATGIAVHTLTAEDGPFSLRMALMPGDEWVWAEVETGEVNVTLSDLSWDLDEADMGSAAVCITTHDRPGDCVQVLAALARDDEALRYLDHVIVVDQGSSRVRNEPEFAAVSESLGARLRTIEQANLGGSGGFSRGMLEAVGAGADHVILLDDDVRLEPESVRRMISLAARASTPVVVGAHMLDLLHPTRLHSWGERVDRSRFEWAPVAPVLQDVELAARDVTAMPADAHVEFNGWWMCLIPATAIRTLGAALPYFIKWDDTEYALRAAAAGIPTVTMPGAALWHLPWTGKDDGLDWQAYFQLRNRIVTALLHARTRRGGSILRGTFALDVNHVLCMQYGSAAARRLALADVLRGPSHLDETLATRVAELHDLMERAAQVVVPDGELPRPRSSRGPVRPRGASRSLGRLIRVAAHQGRRVTGSDPTAVDAHLARGEGKWWALGMLDSATVESATGRGSFVARRRPRVAVALLRDALLLRVRLWRDWPRLARLYRTAAPGLSDARAWSVRYGEIDPPRIASVALSPPGDRGDSAG
ncbi:glycosyltransferase [Microbacterium sp. LWH3-1.2]|uniref:glycosyltransferase n=1 Tax=Microbacterium sp. LWH3-1.2 TaxID=3135256 RepID=UPI003413E6B0